MLNRCSAIHRTLLSRFLPTPSRQALETSLEAAGIEDSEEDDHNPKMTVTETQLIIDDIQASIASPRYPALVPKILFYEVPQHVRYLKEILKDFVLHEPILLIGNQGVGKNKLGNHQRYDFVNKKGI